jgi:hypothetical protein
MAINSSIGIHVPTSIEYINTAAGLLGLLLTAIALLRIQAVRRVQRDERALVRTLYGADSAAAQLRAAAAHLGRARDARARELAQDLIRLCGQIEGVSRVLDASGRQPANGRRSDVVLHEEGYFSPSFLIETIGRANNNIDILMYRPLIASKTSVLDAMRTAAERGVRIRILTLSPNGSDEVLANSAALMPSAAVYRPEQLRPQIIEVERRIAQHLGDWRSNTRARFTYRRYNTMPGPHFIRSDSTIFLGFVGLLSGPLPIRFDERVSAEIPIDTRLGKHVLVHFEQVWQDSEASTMP